MAVKLLEPAAHVMLLGWSAPLDRVPSGAIVRPGPAFTPPSVAVLVPVAVVVPAMGSV